MRPPPFLGELKRAYTEHELADRAAMLTYYGILAVFPMVAFVLTVALLVIPESTIREGLGMLTKAMPEQAASIVAGYVEKLRSAAGGGIAVVSAVLALWAASRGAVALERVLNVVYEVRETRPWWRIQATAVAMTAVVRLLLILALGLLAVGPAGAYLAERFGLGEAFSAVWAVGRWVLAALIMVAIWSLLFRNLPNHARRGGSFSVGAAAGVIFWLAASLLFAVYVSNFGSYEKTYGALGAVVIFLVWMWISNLALLLGAQVNALRAKHKVTAPTQPSSTPHTAWRRQPL